MRIHPTHGSSPCLARNSGVLHPPCGDLLFVITSHCPVSQAQKHQQLLLSSAHMYIQHARCQRHRQPLCVPMCCHLAGGGTGVGLSPLQDRQHVLQILLHRQIGVIHACCHVSVQLGEGVVLECRLPQTVGLHLRPIEMLQHRPLVHLHPKIDHRLGSRHLARADISSSTCVSWVFFFEFFHFFSPLPLFFPILSSSCFS